MAERRRFQGRSLLVSAGVETEADRDGGARGEKYEEGKRLR